MFSLKISYLEQSLHALADARPFSIRLIQLLVAAPVLLLTLVSLNGHLLYFVDLSSNPWFILALVLLEFLILIVWLRSQVRLVVDWFEAAGLILIVAGVWLYLVLPSLPTLLPPSSSGDAANHAAFSDRIYASGYLITSYPAGPALIVATLAHWLGLSTLVLLHPIASFMLALTAGSIYGLACAMLPDTRKHKTLALFTLAGLLIPWGYFAGMLIGGDYFFTQAFAQLLVVAFVWFLHTYGESPHPFWLIGMALALIGIAMSWPLWMLLPVAVLGWILLLEWRRGSIKVPLAVLTFGCVVAGLAFFEALLLITSPELLPRALGRLAISTGDILAPSAETLGGLYLGMPLLGLFLVLKSGYHSRVATAFVLWALLQTAALLVLHTYFGLAAYYTYKTFYLLILPLALFAIIPLARGLDLISTQPVRRFLASRYAFALATLILGAFLFFFQPAPEKPVLAQSDIDTAVWAKEHLATTNINVIGTKSLAASWIGAGIWEEKYPVDLFVDWAALGPKTFDEWRNDPSWGDYLFVTSKQKMPSDPTLQTVYQNGASAILARPRVTTTARDEPPVARAGNILEIEQPASIGQEITTDEMISMTLPIKTLALPAQHAMWRIKVLDHNQQEVANQDIEPFNGQYLLQRWPIGKTLSQSFAFELPSGVEPGLYSVRLSLHYVGDANPLPAILASDVEDDGIDLAQLKVPISSPITGTLADPPVIARFGPNISLTRYEVSRTRVQPGDSLSLGLYWQCLRPVDKNYQVFVHLLDSKGALVAQQDNAPRDGNYPTLIWDAHEIIPDSYAVTLDKNIAPGTYLLEIGMYDSSTQERLDVESASGQVIGDHLVLPVDIILDQVAR